MADQFVACGLEPPGEDYCSCGCDCTGNWCGNPQCWTKHFGFPENHQEKLTANYRAGEQTETMRAAGDFKTIPNRGHDARQ